MIRQASSGLTASARRSSSARSPPTPRTATSLIGSAPSASPSMTTTCCKSGSSARTWSIFDTCPGSSQTITFDPEFPITHSHSAAEFVG
jgi:hypothetical protein